MILDVLHFKHLSIYDHRRTFFICYQLEFVGWNSEIEFYEWIRYNIFSIFSYLLKI